jgi:uncharacterized membrane protein HdeD (DUF308 family)
VASMNPMTAGPPIDKVIAERLRRAWLILLVSGLVSVVAGMLILLIRWTVDDLALFVAVLFVVRGALHLTAPPVDGSDRIWSFLFGALAIAVGIAFVAWPKPSLLTLAIFIGAWIVVAGIFDVAGAISSRHQAPFWWVFLVVGIIEVGLGIALLNRPGLTLALAITLTGIWAIVVGVLQIVIAFEIRSLPERLRRG